MCACRVPPYKSSRTAITPAPLLFLSITPNQVMYTYMRYVYSFILARWWTPPSRGAVNQFATFTPLTLRIYCCIRVVYSVCSVFKRTRWNCTQYQLVNNGDQCRIKLLLLLRQSKKLFFRLIHHLLPHTFHYLKKKFLNIFNSYLLPKRLWYH